MAIQYGLFLAFFTIVLHVLCCKKQLRSDSRHRHGFGVTRGPPSPRPEDLHPSLLAQIGLLAVLAGSPSKHPSRFPSVPFQLRLRGRIVPAAEWQQDAKLRPDMVEE